MNRTQLKELAKSQVNTNISTFLYIFIITYLLLVVVSMIATPLSYILGMLLSISVFTICLKIAEGISPSIKDIFLIFKNISLCIKGVILYLIMSLLTLLWSLLLIVPGIIKLLSISMAPYILIENEYYMTPTDAIKESERIMTGHKTELFALIFSFIGWYILSMLTCGILLIYITPYVNMSLVNFYNEIKDKPEL